MRLPLTWGLYLLSACHTPSQNLPAAPLYYAHLTLSAETIPVWNDTCLQKSGSFSAWAVSIVLQRDRVSDMPEWVSGHRFALTAASETFLPEILIIEAPSSDSTFYPSDSAAQVAWQKALRTWLLEELLPFLSTYPSFTQVAWGRGFTYLPLSENFWQELLSAAREAAPHLWWGLTTNPDTPIPLKEAWDFIGRFVDSAKASEAPSFPPLPKPFISLVPTQRKTSNKAPSHGYVLYSESHLPTPCQ